MRSSPTIEMHEIHVQAPAIDALRLASDWLDDGMRLYFTSGALVSILRNTKKTLLSSGVTNAFGASWNYFDALGSLVVGIEQLRNADEAKRGREFKRKMALKEIGVSAQLTITTIITQMANHGVFAYGATAAGLASLGAFGFAIGMWSSAANEAIALARAIKKMDPLYLIQDRFQKYDNLSVKIQLLKEKEQSEQDENKKAKLAAEIKKMHATQVRLKMQAIAVAKKEYQDLQERIASLDVQLSTSDINVKDKEKLQEEKGKLEEKQTALVGEFFSKEGVSKLRYFIEDQVQNEAELQVFLSTSTQTEKKVAHQVMEKQWGKVKSKMLSTTIWTTAAVGMSLIAAGALFPPLLVPGIAIASVAGALKLYEVGAKMYGKYQDHQQRKTLYQHYEAQLKKKCSAECSSQDEESWKIQVAFELTKITNPTVKRTPFISSFNARFPMTESKKRAKFLNAAVRTMVKREIMRDVLEVAKGDETFNPNVLVSRKDQERMISEQAVLFRQPRKSHSTMGSAASSQSAGSKGDVSATNFVVSPTGPTPSG